MRQSLSGKLHDSPGAAWAVRVVTALLWAVAAACLVFWALQLAPTPALPTTAPPALPLPHPPDPQAVARVLGGAGAAAGSAQAQPAAEASRLVLTGVVARRSGGGSALIAVDGEPPRPFQVGSRVQADLWLQSVQGRQARLGPTPQGTTTLLLELPALPSP